MVAFMIIMLYTSSLGCDIEDEDLKSFQGCPVLDINGRVSLVKKLSQSNEPFAKQIFDIDYIYTLLLPHICKEEKERFQTMSSEDKKKTHLLFPSALWLPEKQLYLAATRISILDSYSYVYVTFFDADWNEIRESNFIGKTKVPSILTLGEMKQAHWWGPEDPRIFRALSNEIFFIATLLEEASNSKRQINLYRFSTATYRKLVLEENKNINWHIEKNWSPLIIDTKHLYFLYKFQGTQIIDCTDEQLPCKRISGSPKELGRTRGSTSYIRFQNTSYYISFAWTNINFVKPHYRPALTILEVFNEIKEFNLIYTSEPLQFENTPISDPKWGDTKYLDNDIRRIIMITSIAKWDFQSGIVDLTLSIDDDLAVVAKIEGLSDFVQYVINVYEYGRLLDEKDCAEKLAEDYYKQLGDGIFINSDL